MSDDVWDSMADRVTVRHSWFSLPDGRVREDVLLEGIYQRLLYSIEHPRVPFVMYDSKATHAWWDGSCLITALVKEGPKALALYKGGKAR